MMTTLLKTKSPIIGVSIPGEMPLVFRRKMVIESMKELEVETAHVVGKYLIVSAVGKNVKAVRKFRGDFLTRLDIIKQLNGWARGERARRVKRGALPSDKKLAAKVSKLNALWAKLEKLTPRIRIPFRVSVPRVGDYERESILAWYREKESRRGLGKQQYAFQRPRKPWCMSRGEDRDWTTLKWGREHFPTLNGEDRMAVKAQIACVLGIEELEVSVYRKRDSYRVEV